MTIGVGELGTTPLGGNLEGPAGTTTDPRWTLRIAKRDYVVVCGRQHMQSFPDKDPGEVVKPAFDWIDLIAAGETIESAAVEVVEDSTRTEHDPSPDLMKLDDPQFTSQSTQVVQKLKDGIDGVTYKVINTIGTSLGRTLIESAFIRVRSV